METELRIKKSCFSAISKRYSLSDIIEEIYSISGAHIAIFELDLKVIACTSAVDSVAWTHRIRDLLSNILHNSLRDTILYQLLSVDYYYNVGSECSYPDILGLRRVTSNGIPDGFLAISTESKDFPPEKLADLVASIYSFYYEDIQPKCSDGDVIKSSISKHLLSGKSEVDNLLYAAYGCITSNYYNFNPDYLILAMCFAESSGGLSFDAVQLDFEMAFPKAFMLREKNILLCILYGIKEIGEGADWDKTLVELCEKHGLICGVSMRFADINSRAEYRIQAINALRLGRAQKDTVYYTSEHLLNVLVLQAIDTFGSDGLILSKVRLLFECDKAKNTDYVDTLESYVNNLGHISETARDLFIDRSTLKYRLKKISALMGDMDLNKAENLRILRLSITAHRIKDMRLDFKYRTHFHIT